MQVKSSAADLLGFQSRLAYIPFLYEPLSEHHGFLSQFFAHETTADELF